MPGFNWYINEDVMGGDTLAEGFLMDSAVEAEAAAFRAIADMLAAGPENSVTITLDGHWADAMTEGPWGGEFVISHPNWTEDYRLTMNMDD